MEKEPVFIYRIKEQISTAYVSKWKTCPYVREKSTRMNWKRKKNLIENTSQRQ